ncbi:putative 1-deoxy-D-xylulose-5-phosphate reductoisomerase [Rosa chinensis]|uniref:Putative 1-deoxy-D-xylulose-5-phosphate reductoisomerase n=1 Tax=Rosa chinensis TaxID=74649 RepID=A0A2P6RH69_ROSCH|nr:putative 1-deoxy-D-xylulose-5-phosphate reductoisomerase [Rosa chinensis]
MIIWLFDVWVCFEEKNCRTVIGRRIQCSAQAPPPAWLGSAFPEPGQRT